MERTDIISLLKKEYNINFIDIKKIKNIYKLTDKYQRKYCLKILNYEYAHCYFIVSAMLHLKKRGFKNVINIILNNENNSLIKFYDKFAYLIPWVDSRESNYNNLYDLSLVSKKLGELHKYSEKFIINKNMNPRIAWFNWQKTFETRGYEILDFQKRISQKIYKSDFDKLYLSMIKKELVRVKESLEGLKQYNYKKVMLNDVKKLCFCHHDYANHNVLIDKNNEVYIIDFDYCILDSNIHDLSSLIIRALKDGNWCIKKSTNIMNNYLKTYNITKEHIPIMSMFIKFPQQFWQVGLQYYWERQLWSEELFLKKLEKYKNDILQREQFVKEFINCKVVE